ncbi:MAG: cytochrome [Sutterellaceae bacterium]|uniref:cytochrome P450 n=1 Tax=Limnobacter sp. UBA7229 TaxID=1946762 RepID=UPI000C46D188|nr:cytochrome P450 [Limnobacter sp. UBA7229]MAG81378.1 cytochrome [Sutterellaceae bacterium]MBT83867.1 cytochrome [Sutterellaceae bacterium]|tara:strand:- start:41161 stop:42393 length:1233 start_codon:yes stop_codon:yes gene_type:complete
MSTASVLKVPRNADFPAHIPEDRVVDFDMYNPPGIEKLGLQSAWKQLQESGLPDLVWTPKNGGHWIATRGKYIRQGFEDHENFSAECPFIPKEVGDEYDFIPTSLNPPEHRHYRSLISAAVGPHIVPQIKDSIRALSRSLIDKFADKGSCNFTHDYAEPFPVGVFLELVDLPFSDAAVLKNLADQMTRPDGSMTFPQARDALYAYLKPIVIERMKNPGKDVISKVVTGKVSGRDLTLDEALRICGLLLVGGLDTVVNFLSFSMQFLANNPKHRKELLDHPEKIPAATEELLRRFSLVADGRLVKNDIEVDGVLLKAGDMILLPQLLTGLDERENQCPMHVDFDRKKVTHTTFGHGVHLCAGQHIARLEIMITLEEFLNRIPNFEIPEGATVPHHGGVVGSVSSLPLVWKV